MIYLQTYPLYEQFYGILVIRADTMAYLSGAYWAPIGRLPDAYRAPCHGQYYGTFCLTVFSYFIGQLQLEGT